MSINNDPITVSLSPTAVHVTPLQSEFLMASSVAYSPSTAAQAGFTPLLGSNGQPVVSNSNGAIGQAYIDANKNVIIAFQGTTGSTAQLYADAQIETSVPAAQISAFTQAIAFEGQVAAAAAAQGIASTNIYTTGHSLGGDLAEYVSQQTQIGGESFGATGIPGYSGANNGTNFTNVINNGDPIGNFGSDTGESGLTGSNFSHYGTVIYQGNISNQSGLLAAASGYGSSITNFDVQQGSPPPDSYTLFALSGYLNNHLLSSYAANQNITLPSNGQSNSPSDIYMGLILPLGGAGATDRGQEVIQANGSIQTPDFNITENSNGTATVTQNAPIQGIMGQTTFAPITTVLSSNSGGALTSITDSSSKGQVEDQDIEASTGSSQLTVYDWKNTEYYSSYQIDENASQFITGQLITADNGSTDAFTFGTSVALPGIATYTSSGALSVSESETNISLGASTTLDIVGNSDIINNNTKDIVFLTGTVATVNGQSGDLLAMAAGSSATVAGNGQTVDLNGSGDTVTTTGSGDAVDDYGSTEVVGGTASTIGLENTAGSQLLTATGTGDNIFAYGSNDTLTGSSENFTFSSGSEALYLNGSSDTINGQSGDLLAMTANSSATVAGNSQTVDLNGNSDTVTTTGSGDAVDDYGSSDFVGGTASTISLENTSGNQSLDATNTGDNINVYGSGDTFTGTSDTLTFSSGSETLSLYGTTDTVDGQSKDIVDFNAYTSATVVGSNETVNLNGYGDNATISGSGDVVDDYNTSEVVGGSASTIGLDGSNGQTLNTTSAGENIYAYSSGDTFSGSNDTLTFNTGSETVYLSGLTDTIDGQAGDTVAFTAYSSATVNGNNETVDLNAYGDNATIGGSGDTVQDFNTAEVVGGSASTIGLDGSGNQTLNATSGGDNITVYSASNADTITASNDTVNDDGASETVAGNAVNLGLDGSNGQVLNATGTGDTIGENNSGDTLNGSNENVYLLGGTSTTQVQSLTIDGNSDTIGATSYDSVSLVGNDTLIANGQGDTVNDFGASDTVGGNGVSIGLDGSNEYLNATGTGDGIGENGSNDTANANSESIYLSGGASASQKQTLTVDGNDDNTYAAQNNTISITGGSDTASLGSGDVTFFTGNQTQVKSDSYTGVVGDEAMFNDQSTNTSELQTVDPTSSSYKGYYDYSAQNGSGKLDDATIDNNSGTSDTTWYSPSSGVTQSTEYFSAADDHGLETSTNFDTSGGNIYDDSFVYSGSTETDYYQTVDNSKGTELAEDEFNSKGQEVAAIYGSGNYGGYDPSYTGGYGYDPGSDSAAAGADISALATKGVGKPDTAPSSMYSLQFHPLFVKPSTAAAPAINTKPSSAILSQAATIEVAAQGRIAIMIQAMASFGTSSASIQTSIQNSLAELHEPVLATALHAH